MPRTAEIMELMPGDVDAALAFLAVQEHVNSSRLGVIGSDCTVPQAVNAARRNTSIKALVLLSGSTDAAGEEYVKTSKMPVFGAASEEDTNAAAAIKRVVSASTNVDSRLTLLKGAGRASTLFAKAPDLETDIVLWLRSSFPVASYAPLK